MIDLNEIIEEQTGEEINLMNSGHVKDIRDCMKEAIRQALELASDEAYTIPGKNYVDDNGLDQCAQEVSKSSIVGVMGYVK